MIDEDDYIDKAPLTPEQWLGIIRGTDDGLLPTCCADISALRDRIMSFMRVPTSSGAEDVARAILDGTGTHGAEDFAALRPLADHLTALLDQERPGWHQEPARDPEELDAWWLILTLTSDSADDTWRRAPRDQWQEPLQHAADYIVSGLVPHPTAESDVEHFETSKQMLAQALRAGAPPAVIEGLYGAARGLGRES